MRRRAPLTLLLVSLLFVPALCFGQKASSEKSSATLTLELCNGVQMEFVLIPAGSFLMGTDENTGDGDESPVHKVVITQPFYIGKHEVTQEQWQALMGNNPSHFKGPKLPVETVSWNDCQKFLACLSEKTGRPASLPTEAQWEYACRAGTTTPWYFGNTVAHASDYAWYGENAENKTHQVGTKKTNPWDLHDMNGNVWEWCSDFYTKHAYTDKEATDPTGPAKGDAHVSRGGAWGDNTEVLRSAARNCAGPDDANQGLGFRCLLPITTTKKG